MAESESYELPPLQYKGRDISLPLSDEDREFLMSRGQDIRVNNADAVVANHENHLRVLAEMEKAESDDDDGSEDVVVDPNDSYANWSEDDLRAELTERKLDTRGKKNTMVKRLEDDDAAEAARNAEPVNAE